jgi:hypothetical protein
LDGGAGIVDEANEFVAPDFGEVGAVGPGEGEDVEAVDAFGAFTEGNFVLRAEIGAESMDSLHFQIVPKGDAESGDEGGQEGDGESHGESFALDKSTLSAK